MFGIVFGLFIAVDVIITTGFGFSMFYMSIGFLVMVT